MVKSGRKVLEDAADALNRLSKELDETKFFEAVQSIINCKGRVVVTGIGKSGHIGKKISATLASTGTPSLFVHPAEASHGDLGMIEKRDVVIAISRSGESPELKDIIVYCRRFGIPIIAITARPNSTLGNATCYLLQLLDISEACPLGLAPTTSTTMSLALGDALAVACLKARDFQHSQFSDFHPGGKLGQKLTRVRDIMHEKDTLPIIQTNSLVKEAVIEMSRGRFGCVGVIDDTGLLIGIFTDGDLRRHISAVNLGRPINELMSETPFRVEPDALIADVTYLFTEKRIPSVFVCEKGKPVGLVHVHDLLQKGFV